MLLGSTHTHTHTLTNSHRHRHTHTHSLTHTHTRPYIKTRARACMCGRVHVVCVCARATRVCGCECVSVRVARAGVFSRVRVRARVCGSVHADVWGPCVVACFVRAFLCARAGPCVRTHARARLSVRSCALCACERVLPFHRQRIFAHVVRVRVRHDCVCMPRRLYG